MFSRIFMCFPYIHAIFHIPMFFTRYTSNFLSKILDSHNLTRPQAFSPGGTSYNGLYEDAPPKGVLAFLDSMYGKGVPFSSWSYAKEVPFQGKVFERVPIFEI